MSDIKHTPGPWGITKTGLSRYVEGRAPSGLIQEVAWCGATEEPGQMDANARLIAAAPELLEAAQEALKLGSKVYHNANAHEATKDWGEVRRLLVDAIAKATGSQS